MPGRGRTTRLAGARPDERSHARRGEHRCHHGLALPLWPTDRSSRTGREPPRRRRQRTARRDAKAGVDAVRGVDPADDGRGVLRLRSRGQSDSGTGGLEFGGDGQAAPATRRQCGRLVRSRHHGVADEDQACSEVRRRRSAASPDAADCPSRRCVAIGSASPDVWRFDVAARRWGTACWD